MMMFGRQKLGKLVPRQSVYVTVPTVRLPITVPFVQTAKLFIIDIGRLNTQSAARISIARPAVKRMGGWSLCGVEYSLRGKEKCTNMNANNRIIITVTGSCCVPKWSFTKEPVE
jgi:hypothetical protein